MKNLVGLISKINKKRPILVSPPDLLKNNVEPISFDKRMYPLLQNHIELD